jgi:hypothetical protein
MTRKWRTRIAAVLLALLTSACIHGQRMKQLTPGMTHDQVVQTLGRPDGVATVEGHTVMTYANRLMSGWSWDRADYHVILDPQGRVAAYGQGQVRANPTTRTVIIVP